MKYNYNVAKIAGMQLHFSKNYAYEFRWVNCIHAGIHIIPMQDYWHAHVLNCVQIENLASCFKKGELTLNEKVGLYICSNRLLCEICT